MRTLVLSDTHLGNGGDYDIFAGKDALPALLDRFVGPDTSVLLNGDSADFLLNDDPLDLDPTRAVERASAIAEAAVTRPTLAVLGQILAAGGQVTVRMGNHDVELALAAVQDVFRRSLGQPADVAARLVFERGAAPHILDVGGVTILVTHGDQSDPFNEVDYVTLPGPGAPPTASAGAFRFPPGSLLVKKILNPLKKRYRMRFADLLKPDFQGGTLAALGVHPAAVRLLFQESSFDIVREVLEDAERLRRDATAAGSAPVSPPAGPILAQPGLGLSDRTAGAGLTPDEQGALHEALLSGPPAVATTGSPLHRARIKLLREGMRLYACAQRRMTGAGGQEFFSFATGDAEMQEVRRLAQAAGAAAVVTGHTHAARWHSEPGLLYANTGTWIWLMQLPDEDASDADWASFLERLEADPALSSAADHGLLESRFTPVVIEPDPEGARVSLQVWEASGQLRVVESDVVRARAG